MDIRDIDKKLQNEFAIKKIKVETISSKNLNLALSNSKYKELESLKRETSFELGKEQAKKNINKKLVKELEITFCAVVFWS